MSNVLSVFGEICLKGCFISIVTRIQIYLRLLTTYTYSLNYKTHAVDTRCRRRFANIRLQNEMFYWVNTTNCCLACCIEAPHL